VPGVCADERSQRHKKETSDSFKKKTLGLLGFVRVCGVCMYPRLSRVIKAIINQLERLSFVTCEKRKVKLKNGMKDRKL